MAKSEPQIPLDVHIDDALNIWNQLRYAFPGLAKLYDGKFWGLVWFCILFHDLGKAHSEFQKMLKKQKNTWNFHRHELFSLPFISGLSNLSDKSRWLIGTIVVGHHKDYESLRTVLSRRYPGRDETEFWASNDRQPTNFILDFQNYVDIEEIKKLLASYDIMLDAMTIADPLDFIREYLRNATAQDKTIDIFYILLSGAFIQCDHLGSAKLATIPLLEKSDFEFLEDLRTSLITSGKNFYLHQVLASKTKGSVILTSPTGSGKTETAFLWLMCQYIEYGQGRVFYVLPFTASINAMFVRLDQRIRNKKTGMVHGKLNEYLNNHFEDQVHNIADKKVKIRKIIESFRSLSTPYKVITPFQLLKNIFGLRHFEKGMFEWYGGYFIFDEIHAYEPKVFAQIIVLLEFVHNHMNAKILVMTATLPTFLKKEIQKVIGMQTLTASEELYTEFRRHSVILKPGKLSDNLDAIADEMRQKKKVLVVCNTVKQAQEIFGRLMTDKTKNGLLLHSVFNGRDRFAKEDELHNSDIDLLVGTQSIEISLDIDYDILFSEPAPFDALLQRFGRVNRKGVKDLCKCIVFTERNEEDKYIYTDETIINKTLQVLQMIANKDGVIHESELQGYIDYVYPGWSKISGEEFNTTYSYLRQSLQEITPFIYAKENEEYYYKQFDGISILPVSLEEEYRNLLDSWDFIGAESLLIKLRSYKFAQWINPRNDNIRLHSHLIEGDKSVSVDYYVTNKKYSASLGLIGNEENKWSLYSKAATF